MGNDIRDYVGVVSNEEVEAPAAVNAGLSQIVALVVFLGV